MFYKKEENIFFGPPPTKSFQDLPKGTYYLNQTASGEIYLTVTDNFTLPSKLYGSVKKRTEKILSTYNSRLKENKSTAILLSGLKGSGKSLLAKNISITSELPTIIIQNRIAPSSIATFLLNCNACIVLFEEFEKTFAHPGDQDSLLSLFDGLYPTKALFILTSNRDGSLNQYFFERPERIYYYFSYSYVEQDIITSYLKENLRKQEYYDKTLKFIELLVDSSCDFNFDLLQYTVNEINNTPNFTWIDFFEGLPWRNKPEVMKFYSYKINLSLIFDINRIEKKIHLATGVSEKRSFYIRESFNLDFASIFSYIQEEANTHHLSINKTDLFNRFSNIEDLSLNIVHNIFVKPQKVQSHYLDLHSEEIATINLVFDFIPEEKIFE